MFVIVPARYRSRQTSSTFVFIPFCSNESYSTVFTSLSLSLSLSLNIYVPAYLHNGYIVDQWSERPWFNPKLSHTEGSEMVLDASLLSNQQFKIRINGKWSNLGKGVAISSKHRFSSYLKRSLHVALNYGRKTYLTYIYIYIYIWRFR